MIKRRTKLFISLSLTFKMQFFFSFFLSAVVIFRYRSVYKFLPIVNGKSIWWKINPVKEFSLQSFTCFFSLFLIDKKENEVIYISFFDVQNAFFFQLSVFHPAIFTYLHLPASLFKNDSLK